MKRQLCNLCSDFPNPPPPSRLPKAVTLSSIVYVGGRGGEHFFYQRSEWTERYFDKVVYFSSVADYDYLRALTFNFPRIYKNLFTNTRVMMYID